MQRLESDANLNVDELIQTLNDQFNVLADDFELRDREVQILRQKLRFSCAEYQKLAAKYASTDPEITSTLAHLQLPADLNDQTGFVPLPSRKQISTQQSSAAIREGRRASRRLSILHGWKNIPNGSASSTSASRKSNCRGASRAPTLTTVLEQDFTVPGKKSDLACPFAPMAPSAAKHLSLTQNGSDRPMTPSTNNIDPTPHQSGDPICAAMYAETFTSPPPSATGSAKCPIRFLDRHTPEEVAKYFEIHKHEVPRSHQICVQRYQRNEEDIRKLDAKYGNLVSMLQGLAPIHQPMLPTSEQEHDAEHEKRSLERVEKWATSVSVNASDKAEEEETTMSAEDERESKFDRPLKEVRLGESPSRPWGITVPFSVESRPSSIPAEISPTMERSAFVDPHLTQSDSPQEPGATCPFSAKQDNSAVKARTPGQCPFSSGLKAKEHEASEPQEHPEQNQTAKKYPQPYTEQDASGPPYTQIPQPAFIQAPNLNPVGSGPQMVFNGPVFIGYPIEQAMAFMKQYQSGTGR